MDCKVTIKGYLEKERESLFIFSLQMFYFLRRGESVLSPFLKIKS